jgi:hypothetical protein
MKSKKENTVNERVIRYTFLKYMDYLRDEVADEKMTYNE